MNLLAATKPSVRSSWKTQNADGRAKAVELIDRIVTEECPPLLGWALREMIAKGEFGGVEVGFAQELAERLIQKE